MSCSSLESLAFIKLQRDRLFYYSVHESLEDNLDKLRRFSIRYNVRISFHTFKLQTTMVVIFEKLVDFFAKSAPLNYVSMVNEPEYLHNLEFRFNCQRRHKAHLQQLEKDRDKSAERN